MNAMNVTSIEKLMEYSKGNIVQLPDFAEGQPFVARLRRPSIMALAKSGKIPNSLLTTANSLFMKGGVDAEDDAVMKDVFEVFDILCDATFVEPTYKDIKDNGIELTDDQYMFIFNYTQNGVKALEPFRGQFEHTESAGNSTEV